MQQFATIYDITMYACYCWVLKKTVMVGLFTIFNLNCDVMFWSIETKISCIIVIIIISI